MGFPSKVVFVGGAPRSGTSLAHALICTAPGVSRYHPEISFFRSIPLAYHNGLNAWDGHTRAFYPDREAFRLFVRETAMRWLGQIADAVQTPSILCVKDPHLTALFPELHVLLPREAVFVTVARHPYAVVRSRQTVHEKSGASPPFSDQNVLAVAREYMAAYARIVGRDFGGRHLLVRYEDLGSEALRARLAAFVGVEGFDLQSLWKTSGDEARDPGETAANAWLTPKYFGEIQVDPVPPMLEPSWRDIVDTVCAPVLAKMGYAD